VRTYEEDGWRKITGVEASHSDNFGNYLLFDVTTVVSPPTKRALPYSFFIELFMLNYAPVTSLSSMTIDVYYYELKNGHLLSEGYGSTMEPEYFARLERRFTSYIVYGVKTSDKNTSLDNYMVINPSPMPAPVSSLF